MSTPLPWIFEECSPEDECDSKGVPWQHAVRGRKPARPMVMGYGHSLDAADTEARKKAQQQDARELIGERGEVKTAVDIVPLPREIDFVTERRRVIQGYGTCMLMSSDEYRAFFHDLEEWALAPREWQPIGT